MNSQRVRWTLGVAIALLVAVVPLVYYRMSYIYQKRLRVVTPGKFYRSGCMTAAGLESAIKTYGLRTVINLMEEAPDPLLYPHYFARASIPESKVVERSGARYIPMTVTYLGHVKALTERPITLERYLEILDDPASYPVLVHCKAGLHRTGVLVAVYRMEYEGWSWQDALAEVKANGFGEFVSSSANEYIDQYILKYRPHLRPSLVDERLPMVPGTVVNRPTKHDPSAFAPLPKE